LIVVTVSFAGDKPSADCAQPFIAADCSAPVYFVYGCRFTSSGAKRATPSAPASLTLILAHITVAVLAQLAPPILETKLIRWNALMARRSTMSTTMSRFPISARQ
jgi:hypothetical protein